LGDGEEEDGKKEAKFNLAVPIPESSKTETF
jgi:hypothetical protein